MTRILATTLVIAFSAIATQSASARTWGRFVNHSNESLLCYSSDEGFGYLPPGRYTPDGEDWDFIYVDGVWHKISGNADWGGGQDGYVNSDLDVHQTVPYLNPMVFGVYPLPPWENSPWFDDFLPTIPTTTPGNIPGTGVNPSSGQLSNGVIADSSLNYNTGSPPPPLP